MAYGYPNYSYTPYSYNPPMPDQLAQLRGQPYPQQPAQNAPFAQNAQSGSNVIWVLGEDAAMAYMCAPGSSVMLFDSEGSTFYIKTTDASGMPQPLRVFDFRERVQASKTAQSETVDAGREYVTRAEFDEFRAKLEASGTKKTKKESVNDEQSAV